MVLSHLEQWHLIAALTSHVDEAPAPSVGARAAAEMGENDECKPWRVTARD